MSNLRQLLHGVRLIGLRNALRALANSWRRDRLEARFPQPAQTDLPVPPGPLQAAESLPGGARFHFGETTLEVRFLAPDLVFVAWGGVPAVPSYAVVPNTWPPVDTRLEADGAAYRLSSAEIHLSIRVDGQLEWYSREGALLRSEGPPEPLGYGWRLHSDLAQEACVYGLGERAAPLNLRPGRYRLWNQSPGGNYGAGTDPLYISMPLYLVQQSAGSYWIFYDNTFDGQVQVEGDIQLWLEGGPLRYYLAAGALPTLFMRLKELTGAAPLPPRWALGYQQSRWGYRSQAEMQRVLRGFQEHDLPLSALTLDADAMRGYRTLTVDVARYPDLPALADQARQSDVRLVACVDPAVRRDPAFDLYQQGLQRDLFCKTPNGQLAQGVGWPGYTVFPDFTDPAARDWWADQYSRLLDLGITGLWHDMGEPECAFAWGEQTLPLCTRHNLDGHPADHRAAHNVYGMLLNQAGYEALRRLRPQQRPFMLSRSGWVGMQRHAWTWTADMETSWRMLRQTIAAVLGTGLCGVPYSGPDIGGFSGHPSAELFVRWFQLASCLPFFRTHCAFYLPNREPWEFGQPVLDILRAHLKERYRRLPLWYTLAWEASQTGQPIVRPLFWIDPTDQALWAVDDAFLVGDTLLVAPALEAGAQERQVRLPRCGWYDLATGRYYPGGGTVELEAPLDRLPRLARAGSLLPEEDGDLLTLHLFRPSIGESGGGHLYTDPGDGYGAYRIDRFEVRPDPEGYAFTWTAEGQYPWSYRQTVLHLHGFSVAAVRLGTEERPLTEGRVAIQPLSQVVLLP